MTVPANTFQAYTQVNIREDLINMIYNVDPIKTPLLNMAKKAEANQTFHEWNTDSLAAQNLSNWQVEGDVPANLVVAPTTRLGNYCQILGKTIEISGTSQAVVAAGGTNKMGYQLAKKAKELKRDIEGAITQNVARAAGSSSTPRKLAGLPAWIASNEVFQSSSSGADPSEGAPFTGANPRTYNGTQTALTEAQVKTVLQKVYSSSGESPEYALVSPVNKQNISAFTGVGTRFTQVEDKILSSTVDIYESDFGEVKIIPDIFLANSHDVFFINPNYIRLAYLRPFQTIPLAKTADADQKMLLCEMTIEVGNEKSCGAVYDTTG